MQWAAIQITASSNKEDNYKKISHWVEKAVQTGAKNIVLPEYWNWLGRAEDKIKIAETMDGPSIQFIQKLAKKFSCLIVAGSIAEIRGESKPPYNTSVIVHPDGKLGQIYRKIHLFDAKVGQGYVESTTTSAGEKIVVENLGGTKLGLAICYDVRFPELFRRMASMRAEIFAIPANFTAVTGPPHWEVLVRARAIENQCFVVASDQTGLTGAGWEAHGHSMIVDPWGEILAEAKREEGIITALLDFEKLKQVRLNMPVHEHRKSVLQFT